MSHAVVTLALGTGRRVDLALPLNVPTDVLAPALAKALELPAEGEGDYLFSVKTAEGLVRLPAKSTLAEAEVLDGSILQLQRRFEPAAQPDSRSGTYLQLDSGQRFFLAAGTTVIGRADIKRGARVDIDLTPFDSAKAISRTHAKLEHGGGRCTITDLNSTNRTSVNGQQLTPGQARLLEPGDTIVFGRNVVQMKFVKS